MKYRTLGNTGIRVSTISLGSMFFGGAQYQATNNPVSKDEAINVIHKALELDINYLDCADIYGAYGEAERIIGEAIQAYDRNHILLSTKAMMPMSYNEFDRGLSRKHLIKSIDRSLQNFGTDYVDLYYAHRYDHYSSVEEIVKTMNNLINEGKIRYWATSNWAPNELERVHMYCKSHGYEGPIVDQTKYYFYRRHPSEIALPYTLDYHGMKLVSYGVLGKGVFAGIIKSTRVEDLTDDEKRLIQNELPTGRGINQQILDNLHAYYDLARSLDLTPAQLTYQWALQSKRVSTVLMSTRHPDRIQENLDALEGNISTETITRIHELFPLEYREFDTYIRVNDNPNTDIIGKIPEDMMKL